MRTARLVRALWLGCAVCLLSSCDDGGSDPVKLSPGYLPLEVGNYWDFIGVNSATDDVVLHREVKAIVKLNGHEYYLTISSVPSGKSIADSAYYRVDDQKNVYLYRKSMENEELKYKLDAKEGDTWTYPFFNDDYMDVVLYIGPIETSSKTVNNCKNYYFDAKGWVDEEYTSSLAPGVGFIKEYSDAWGVGMVLSKASIGGNVIEF
ncbi:hypothetical protein WBG78_21930 [Chryseolinea sp. T2]|uniref:hypothetical protein n=1 Tax=Chryseolinea sp. T2 TaxID=3129255 RepID=UPI0030773BA0